MRRPPAHGYYQLCQLQRLKSFGCHVHRSPCRAGIGRSTARLLAQMDATVERANAKVLLYPFDAPAAVKSSNAVATGVLDFRGRLGIEAGYESTSATRWTWALAGAGQKMRTSATEGAAAAALFSASQVDRATEAFRAVDTDGDGIPDKRRAVAAAEEASAAVKGAAAGVTGAFGTFFGRRRTDVEGTDTPAKGSKRDEP